MAREELRDYVEEQRSLGVIPYHVYSTLIDGIDTLEQEPKTGIRGEWIPVSERLPKVGENGLSEWVLVTIKGIDKTVTMCDKICHGEWLTPCFDGEEVLAWQPLPEPYKAEKGGDK